MKHCLHCSKPIQPDALAAKRAPHQRFCSKVCRQGWHSNQRALGAALATSLGGKIEDSLYDRVAKVTGVDRAAVKLVVQALAAGAGQGAG